MTAGVIAGAVAVKYVLSGPGSPRPEGMELVWAVLWTGVVYGVVDALLLTVMPIFAVWSVGFGLGWSSSWPGRIATAFWRCLPDGHSGGCGLDLPLTSWSRRRGRYPNSAF